MYYRGMNKPATSECDECQGRGWRSNPELDAWYAGKRQMSTTWPSGWESPDSPSMELWERLYAEHPGPPELVPCTCDFPF